MAEKRLIDANTFLYDLETLKSCLLGAPDVGKDRAKVVDIVIGTLSTAPTVQHECSCKSWHPASEIPPLHHVTDDDDSEDVLEYEASDPLLLYTANGRTVSGARYVKSDLFVGWDDWSGGLFNTEVTHWMPQPRPPKGQKHG